MPHGIVGRPVYDNSGFRFHEFDQQLDIWGESEIVFVGVWGHTKTTKYGGLRAR
jgi:hypothetical protein